MTSLARRFRDLRYSIFYRLFLNQGFPLETLGNRATGCAWTFHPESLNGSSIIYAGGVGKDITFERDLVEQYGCAVVLLDPSPTGRETMAQPENQIPEFKFVPIALARHCGEVILAPPGNPKEGSWFANTNYSVGIKVPCMNLQALMDVNGHTRIDLLKLDIEGSEYEVIDGFLRADIPVGQLCVEFHHGMRTLPDVRRNQTIRAMFKLAMHGYKLVHVDGSNHTFLKSKLLERRH
jgi:FkbM family methyltransferase